MTIICSPFIYTFVYYILLYIINNEEEEEKGKGGEEGGIAREGLSRKTNMLDEMREPARTVNNSRIEIQIGIKMN